MASSGVNVLRYSALVGGIVYGIYHQRSIRNAQALHKVEAEYRSKETLLDKARREWAKKSAPAQAKTDDGGIIMDPMDPKFDLEAYLTMKSTEDAKT